MDYIIEIINKNNIYDKLKTKSLFKNCFDDNKDFIEYYYDVIIKRNIIICAKKNDKIISMVHLNPYLYNINNKNIILYYLVAICTDANYRNNGYIKKILNYTFDYLKSLNTPFCFLIPFNESIENLYLSKFNFKIISKFNINKFSNEDYDIYPVRNDEFNNLMKKENDFLLLENEEYKNDLMNKNVLAKIIDINIFNEVFNEKFNSLDNAYNFLNHKKIYFCMEV